MTPREHTFQTKTFLHGSTPGIRTSLILVSDTRIMNSTQTESTKPKRSSMKGIRNPRPVLGDLRDQTTDGANKSQSAVCSFQSFLDPTLEANTPILPVRTLHGGRATLAATGAVTATPSQNKIKKKMDRPPTAAMAKGNAPSTKKKNASAAKKESLFERITGSRGLSTDGDDFRFDIDETSYKRAIKFKEEALKPPRRSSDPILVSDESRDENDQLSASTSKSSARLNPGGGALVPRETKGKMETSKQACRRVPRGAFSIFQRHRGRATSNSDDTHHVVAGPSKPVSLSHFLRQIHLSDQRFPQAITTATKITIVSEEHKIFVVDLLPAETCDWILQETTNHVAHCVKECRVSYRKLYTHTLHDLPCSEVVALRPLTNQLLHDIRKLVGHLCTNPQGAATLVPRSWKEPHLLRYGREHTGMCMHYDGGALTWQMMLSSHGTDYNGT